MKYPVSLNKRYWAVWGLLYAVRQASAQYSQSKALEMDVRKRIQFCAVRKIQRNISLMCLKLQVDFFYFFFSSMKQGSCINILIYDVVLY